MTDPNDLARLLSQGWDALEQGVTDRHSPARTPTLATVSAEGRPEARTVVLRAADRAAALLEMHTDRSTPKIAALLRTPYAALHVWLPKLNLQIRVTARAEVRTGAEVADRWDKVPAGSRVAYGTEPAPGQPIAEVFAYDKPADPARFAVIFCHVEALDLLDLGARHRRARFVAGDGWAGEWLAP